MTDGISGQVTSTSSSACREFTRRPCHGQRELCANADVDGVADVVDVVDQVDIAKSISTALVMLNENFVQMLMMMALLILWMSMTLM